MAQLKDTTIQGSARVTDTLYSNAVQAKIFNIPTASNGTTYGPGTDGQVLKSNGASVYWASDSNSDINVKQLAAITTSGAYPIILANSTATTEVTGTVNKSANLTYNPNTKALSTGGTINGLTFTAATTGFTIAGGTTSKTLTVSNTYTLGAACAKGVTDNSSNADVTSSDTNLITGRTLYYQLAKKGYTTNTGTVTSVTLTQGAGITVSDSGTAITASGSRTISITGMNTTSGSTSKCLTEKGTWASFSNNAGTVTSVQVQASSPLQSSTSTAQSATLSTTISFTNQDPNKVLAGPSSGSSAGAPSFRALVAADIPDLAWSKITSGKPTTLSGYGITDAAASGHTQAVNKGGTNITSYAVGDILYASGTTTLSKLAGNTTTTQKFLAMTGTGSAAAAPQWVEASGGDILVVTVTYASNLYFANKTLSEIITAFNNGKVVFAKYSSEKIYTLRTLSSTAAVFSRLYYLSNGMYEDTCTITSSNVTMSTTRRISDEIVEYLTIEVEYSDSEGRYTASCYQLDNPSVWDIYNFLDSNLKKKYVRVLMYKYGTSTVPSGASDPPEEPYYLYWYNVTDASSWYEWNSEDEYWQMRHSIALSCVDSRGSEPKLCTITITDTEDGEGCLLANATVTYTESALGGDYLPLSGGTMTGPITLNNGVAINTANEAGWSMNQYGNFTHRRSNANDYLGVVGGSGDFRVYYDNGNVTTNGYVAASNGIYATNGILCTRGSTAWVQFQNASAQAIGEIWSQSGRIYIRERPSAGSSYVTDIVFPTAKSNGNENVYVYTSRNFSLSGTTLTITVPS